MRAFCAFLSIHWMTRLQTSLPAIDDLYRGKVSVSEMRSEILSLDNHLLITGGVFDRSNRILTQSMGLKDKTFSIIYQAR